LNKKITTHFNTIKYLKFRQIFYRLYYFFRKTDKSKYIRFSEIISYPLIFQESINSYNSYKELNNFTFINISHKFNENIDWDYKKNGMLWAYNLNYFEFLLQKNMSKEAGLKLINNYIGQHKNIKIGFDSYPISLRNIFWIRFISQHSIKDKRIDSFLFDSYKILLKNLEYHILANHLLENAFSLLFGAYYFKEEKIYKKAYKLLKIELNEQILNDGAHFELSPMYHQIILYRLLDCINLLSNNIWKSDDLLEFLTTKASLMLSWLENMTFSSGKIPLINDAAENIAPTSKELFEYAKRLNIKYSKLPLSDSNYRILENEKYKCIIDIGGIAPNYQPGHSHADTFNFVLEINNRPVIIDTGTSTYENNATRHFERGTSAHNTVVIKNQNSSNVWGSHRVAQRAKVNVLECNENIISAIHNGYGKIGTIHKRTFNKNDNLLQIIDEINSEGVAYFHFQPNEQIEIKNNAIVGKDFSIIFSDNAKIELCNSYCSFEFNKQIENESIKVIFFKKLETNIQIKNQ